MRRVPLLVAAILVAVVAVVQACTSRAVVEVVVEAVDVEPPTATVYVGDSVRLTATVEDDRGVIISQARPLWEASAPTIATVDSTGMVHGLRAGGVDISALFGSAAGTAHITVTPRPLFDFVVAESSGTTVVTEAGGTDEITVVLLTQPTEDVVLLVSSGDEGEVTVSPASITFTADSWNIARAVQVTGQDDELVDGDQTTAVTFTVDVSASDPSFADTPPKAVDVVTRDDEVSGVILESTNGSTSAVEGSASDTVTVQLSVRPNSDVYLAVSVDDPSDATVSPEALTFTRNDWDVPQVVVFSAVDDSIADGVGARTISVSVEAGSDGPFLGLPPSTLDATTVDNEAGGWVLSHTDGTTVAVEGGASDSIAVTLASEPASMVVLEVTVGHPEDATVSPASLIFSPGGAVTQWVTFRAVDDPDLDGTRQHAVTVSVGPDSDLAFMGLPDQVIVASTEDNDVAGFTISESGDVTIVDENGGTDSFVIELAARPSTDVAFQVSSGDLSEVAVAPTTVTFTRATWDQPRSVTVAGVDDDIGDGDQVTDITVAVDPGSDAAFVGLPAAVVKATTVDDDGIGIVLGETNGTIVDEAGALSDAVAVRLTAVPVGDVVLDVSSADIGEMTVQPTTLTFTPQNGSDPQAVVVQGVDDSVADGDQVTELRVSVNLALTQDPAYDTVSARTVSVTTLDDEAAAIEITETDESTVVDESGTTDEIIVRLTAQPNSDVVLNVSSADRDEVRVDTDKLTFKPSDWSVPRTVVVRGHDDSVLDGSQFTDVTFEVDNKSDPAFRDLPAQTVVVETTDDEIAALIVTESGGETIVTEGGSTDKFEVRLASRPAWSVTLLVSSPDPGEVTVSPSSVTFTRRNWDHKREFTVTGVDDQVADGDQTTLVLLEVDASVFEPVYNAPDQTVEVITVDDEVAGFTITESNGETTVDESGTTDTFTVVLDERPESAVTLNITTADPGEVEVQTSTVSFTPENWFQPRVVTVAGVGDGVPDGAQLTDVTVAVDAGSPPAFAELAPQIVSVLTNDID